MRQGLHGVDVEDLKKWTDIFLLEIPDKLTSRQDVQRRAAQTNSLLHTKQWVELQRITMCAASTKYQPRAETRKI